jgi:hypothetical protein
MLYPYSCRRRLLLSQFSLCTFRIDPGTSSRLYGFRFSNLRIMASTSFPRNGRNRSFSIGHWNRLPVFGRYNRSAVGVTEQVRSSCICDAAFSTSSASTALMFEHLSILTVATPVPTVLVVSFGHETMTSSLSAALAAKPRRRGIVLNHFFRISSPARIVADLSVRVRSDLNCGT